MKGKKDFSVRYTYEGFDRIYDICAVSPLTHKLRRINSRNELTHKILKGIIEHQSRYLETGNSINLALFSQIRLTEWINKSLSDETQYDNSWTSRLVSRLSVITPFGEEKPLKWFFQTRKDINKRLIKQLLDKESEDLQSGKLKKPYTDNELKGKLEAFFLTNYELRTKNYSFSRHSICHCRKDMGVPPAKRRLSGYKYPPLSANFSMPYPLTIEAVTKYAPEQSGVYEFSVKSCLSLRGAIATKQSQNTVIYIGSTKNIRKRLREHLGKNSKNGHIKDFLKKFGCSFRYILLKKGWQEEEKNLYKLFVATYGSAPKCNRVRP
ncbi:MAG: GIY-YIG nuclease family protein [bacterium]